MMSGLTESGLASQNEAAHKEIDEDDDLEKKIQLDESRSIREQCEKSGSENVILTTDKDDG